MLPRFSWLGSSGSRERKGELNGETDEELDLVLDLEVDIEGRGGDRDELLDINCIHVARGPYA